MAGSDDKVDTLAAKYRDEFEQGRTVKFGSAKQDGRGDFFLLLGGTGTAGATIEDVKFVSGSEGMKEVGGAPRGVKYSQRVQDDTPVKILRRGRFVAVRGNARWFWGCRRMCGQWIEGLWGGRV